MSKLKIASLNGRIEMIDYCLTAFCDAEFTNSAKAKLKNLKFGYQDQIERIKAGEAIKRIK